MFFCVSGVADRQEREGQEGVKREQDRLVRERGEERERGAVREGGAVRERGGRQVRGGEGSKGGGGRKIGKGVGGRG